MSSEGLTVLAHLHMQRDFTAERIEYREPMTDVPGRQVDIPKLKRGGVDCIWLSEGAPGEFTVDPMAARHATVQPSSADISADVLRGGTGRAAVAAGVRRGAAVVRGVRGP